MRGFLHFYFETGTEGAYWAFINEDEPFRTLCQDENYHFDYNKMRLLKDGDKLTIFDKDNPAIIVWKGTVSLTQYPVFTQHVFNFWIHSEQKGITRENWAEWFFREYPAELFPAAEQQAAPPK